MSYSWWDNECVNNVNSRDAYMLKILTYDWSPGSNPLLWLAERVSSGIFWDLGNVICLQCNEYTQIPIVTLHSHSQQKYYHLQLKWFKYFFYPNLLRSWVCSELYYNNTAWFGLEVKFMIFNLNSLIVLGPLAIIAHTYTVVNTLFSFQYI